MSVLTSNKSATLTKGSFSKKRGYEYSSEDTSSDDSYRQLVIESESNIYNTKKVAKKFVSTVLKVAGIHDRGRLNYHNIEVVDNLITYKELPWTLDGLKVLHLSNLYLSSDKGIANTIFSTLKDINYDICVLSGGIGFCADSTNDLKDAAKKLMDALKGNVYVVGGVGDRPEMLEALADAGACVLSNESKSVSFLAENILIYGSDCMRSAHSNEPHKLESIEDEFSFSIFVSQNPLRGSEADRAGYSLMLSGASNCQHCALAESCKLMQTTQQIKSKNPDACACSEGMRCYETSGVGSSFLPVRFFSQPEIIVHTIKAE